MADPNLTQVAASAWDQLVGDGKPNDAIFDSFAFFNALGSKGMREGVTGGQQIEVTLEYAENTNFHAYGEKDEISTAAVDTFSASQFPWKTEAGAVSYSNLESLRVMGDRAKFDLIAGKLENGRNSHIASMNRALWGDGTGNAGADFTGIQVHISTTPTTGSVGGIDRATFTFHRNQQNSGVQTSSAYDNYRSALTTTYNDCSLGGMKKTPTWLMTNQTDFEGYEKLLVAIEQIEKRKQPKRADVAFLNRALEFKGVDFFYDEDALSGNTYMGNPDDLHLVYLRGGWMHMDPPVDPYNQLTQVHKVSTHANLVGKVYRHLGVVDATT